MQWFSLCFDLFFRNVLPSFSAVLFFASQANAMAEQYHGHQDSISAAFTQLEEMPIDKRNLSKSKSLLIFPLSRWTLPNIVDAACTIPISRGDGRAFPLTYALRSDISDIKFTPLGSDGLMSFVDALNETYTDGIMIMHNGIVVYEQYSDNFDRTKRHLGCSVTKSFVGLIAAMLIHEGKLNEDRFAEHYVPEFSTMAFSGATVRQMLNMEISVNYSENYADVSADIWKYLMAGGMLERPPTYAGPSTLRDYMLSLPRDPNEMEHGRGFRYKTVITGGVDEMVTRLEGMPMGDIISKRIWQDLGAEFDAHITIDSEGKHFSGAGLATTLSDLARFAEMIRQDGYYNGKQIVAKKVIDDIRENGDKEAFRKSAGFEHLAGWAYHKHWWINGDILMMRGTFGQHVYIDRKNNVVVVKYSSTPRASNTYLDHLLLPAFDALASHLSMTSDLRPRL